jgi:hypothetical protein
VRRSSNEEAVGLVGGPEAEDMAMACGKMLERAPGWGVGGWWDGLCRLAAAWAVT